MSWPSAMPVRHRSTATSTTTLVDADWPAWFGPGAAGKGPAPTAGISPAAHRCSDCASTAANRPRQHWDSHGRQQLYRRNQATQ